LLLRIGEREPILGRAEGKVNQRFALAKSAPASDDAARKFTTTFPGSDQVMPRPTDRKTARKRRRIRNKRLRHLRPTRKKQKK
jgi:hypothetical protein